MASPGGVASLLALLALLAAAPSAAAGPVIAVTDVNFGNVRVGTTAAQNITVANVGNAPLELQGLTISGTTAGASFTAGSGSCGSYPRTIPVNGSCTVQIQFQPFSRGTKTASAVFASDSDGGGDSISSLTGTGVAPVVGVAPESIGFGPVRTGTSKVEEVTISNSGDAGAGLMVTGLGMTGAHAADFTVTGGTCGSIPFTVAAGTSCSVGIEFAPGAVGARTAALTVDSNDPTTSAKSVPLAGGGTDQALGVTPASISFPDQVTGNAGAAQIVTLTNTGSAGDLALSSVALSGAEAAHFAIGDNACSPPKTLGPGQSCTLAVRFSPSAAGPLSALLRAVSDAGTAEAALSGTGVAPTADPVTDAAGGSTSPDPGSDAAQPPGSVGAPVARCIVPKLKGRTLAAAKAALRRANCRLGAVKRALSRLRPGRVLRQRRRPGARLPAGTRVALVVSRRR